jgi:hypothetical protein
MPRNQQFLTIGRSTTNNMTLRYRTVSQLHAKIKFQDVSLNAESGVVTAA